jgi:hypothetical protein
MIRTLKIQRIDLLKIDVEGAEMDVLTGIEEEHWPAIQMISMEVAPANKAKLRFAIACEALIPPAHRGVLDRENPLMNGGPDALRCPAPGF